MKKLFLFNALLLAATSVFATTGLLGMISSPANAETMARCTAQYNLTVVDSDGNVLGNYQAVATGSSCASAMESAKGSAYVEAYTMLHS
ncbi:hypothetical protein SAMN04487898_12460 [Pedobacter sp. ok626]|uniref:hypothetical protein n=1 Tax=Pedobacter sp. ok626 TaxID=1761882 RepID=UPI000889C255|nr:hypothetical protein [Pedobacter sp. ok626]SDL76572.1 hypothetical protein SAMN04487898_12460 [Pedobacter sp. ok626]